MIRSDCASPNHFQGKLDLTRWCLCGGNQSRTWDAIACLIEDSEVVGWRGKISPIKEIEKLRPELDIHVFRKQPDVVILKGWSLEAL